MRPSYTWFNKPRPEGLTSTSAASAAKASLERQFDRISMLLNWTNGFGVEPILVSITPDLALCVLRQPTFGAAVRPIGVGSHRHNGDCRALPSDHHIDVVLPARVPPTRVRFRLRQHIMSFGSHWIAIVWIAIVVRFPDVIPRVENDRIAIIVRPRCSTYLPSNA